ncbi:hypothetical protein FB563_7033 [Streptomyces puniciscabiei]|uniref:Uncharacterized protein n=1 Tax=Streptomyces puniciscabiei TaxID=164348 RepID=A0A542TJ69_9ACTN|nr:hypothetical protein FB563_8044 [Streptomyces puniciscabiei]TQK86879.1 hypothetical protein FB563_7033 [Streptomyces puniciscabiei]
MRRAVVLDEGGVIGILAVAGVTRDLAWPGARRDPAAPHHPAPREGAQQPRVAADFTVADDRPARAGSPSGHNRGRSTS